MPVSDAAVQAGVLVTGTELLRGTISDANGPWVAERLGELGVEVTHVIVVGDRPADLEAGLRFLTDQGARLIVTSGGLGPTADDLTAEVVARFAGRELVLDEKMEVRIAAILERFAKRLRFDPDALREANRKQAMVPRGAIALDPAGTAPGLVVAVEDGPVVVVLPGPPRELQAMWDAALATPPVRELLGATAPYGAVLLRLFGIPESEIAQTLRDLETEGVALERLEITTCLRKGELEVDVRHAAGAERELQRLVEGIERRHGRYLFSRDGSTIDEQLAELLAGRRVAVAESCTGGMLAARLTARPGASGYVAGGVVAYSNEAKSELLGVPAPLIAERGAVSPEVAEAMADAALARFDADLAVAITGIAGPGGGTEQKPVGYVCVCVKGRNGERLARDPVLPGSREDIRERSTLLALHLLRRVLRGEDFPL